MYSQINKTNEHTGFYSILFPYNMVSNRWQGDFATVEITIDIQIWGLNRSQGAMLDTGESD